MRFWRMLVYAGGGFACVAPILKSNDAEAIVYALMTASGATLAFVGGSFIIAALVDLAEQVHLIACRLSLEGHAHNTGRE